MTSQAAQRLVAPTRPPSRGRVLWTVVGRVQVREGVSQARLPAETQREITSLLDTWYGDAAHSLTARITKIAAALAQASGPGMLYVTGTRTSVLTELVLDRPELDELAEPLAPADRRGAYRTVGEQRSRTVCWAGFDLPRRQHGQPAEPPPPEDVWD